MSDEKWAALVQAIVGMAKFNFSCYEAENKEFVLQVESEMKKFKGAGANRRNLQNTYLHCRTDNIHLNPFQSFYSFVKAVNSVQDTLQMLQLEINYKMVHCSCFSDTMSLLS